MMRRTRLVTRISLLGAGIAVLTSIIAGSVSVGLIRATSEQGARTTLSRLADVAESVADRSPTQRASAAKVRTALGGLNVRLGFVNRSANLVTAVPLVREAVTPADIAAVLGGRDVSTTRTTPLGRVLVEGRPSASGGLFAVQRTADAFAVEQRAIQRIVIALCIATAVAVILGLVMARELAKPLRRTAQVANDLAAGHRDLSVPTIGPTEVAEVAEAVNALSAALTQSESRQREFLLSVSHDLRTPLTAISGYAEALVDHVIAPEETAHVGGVMLAESRRLERLVGDLLDLARLSAQDFPLEIAPADLADLVARAGAAWRDRCRTAGVDLRLEVAAGQLPVVTDVGRIRQALDALVENAVRITPAGQRIVLAAYAEDRVAALEVRDGGPGLSDADLAVAFDRGELNRRYRGVREVGSGLGLAIVHSLVTRLGGTVTAGHAPEGGARLTIHLPLAQPPLA